MELGIHADQQHHAHISQQPHQVDGQEDQEEGDVQVPAICDAQKDEFSRGIPSPGEVLWPHPAEQKMRKDKAEGGKGNVMNIMREKALCTDIRTWVLVLPGNEIDV